MTVYKADQAGGRRGRRAGHRAGQGRGGRDHRQTVKDTESGKEVPAVLLEPGRDHQGQRQGRHRRRLRHQGRALHRRLRRRVHGSRHLVAGHRPPGRSCTGAPAARLRRRAARLADRPARVRTDRRVPRTACRATAASCAGSTRASARCRCCTTSTSTVYPGQVTALVGDNGAGKSTLVKCVSGIYTIDSGEFRFDGRPVTIHNPRDAAALGIEVVYQDLALCDNLDIVQNMFLGRERTTAWSSTSPRWSSSPRETLAGLSVRTVKSVRQQVASLSGGQRQTVAIAKAVLWNIQARHPRRADRRARRRADRPGARAGPPARRQRPRRRADLAQHERRVRGRRPDRRALPRPDGRPGPATDVTRSAGRRTHHGRAQSATSASPPSRGRGSRGLTAMSSNAVTAADQRPRSPAVRRRGFEADRPSRLVQRRTSAPTSPGPRRRDGCAAGRARAGRAVHRVLHPAARHVPDRRQLRQPAHPGRAPSCVIAMGLVFVLLLGEIDLSAGFTSGVCAAVLADRARPTTACPGTSPCSPPSSPACVIGLFIGMPGRRKIGIPSFVVTLARFLAFQGVVLLLIAGRHDLDPRPGDPRAIGNKNLPPCCGWVARPSWSSLGYAAIQLDRWRDAAGRGPGHAPLAGHAGPRSASSPWSSSLGAAYVLNQERSRNSAIDLAQGRARSSCRSSVVLLVVLTFVLEPHGDTACTSTRSAATRGRPPGRHQRRRGSRITAFVICSTHGGGRRHHRRQPRLSSVDADTGGSNVLLYAVGAAVIGGTSLFGGKGRVLDAVLGGAGRGGHRQRHGPDEARVRHEVHRHRRRPAARRRRGRALPPPRGGDRAFAREPLPPAVSPRRAAGDHDDEERRSVVEGGRVVEDLGPAQADPAAGHGLDLLRADRPPGDGDALVCRVLGEE